MDPKQPESTTGGQTGMRIFHVLDKIENAIYNSQSLYLTKYVLVDKEKILRLIQKTREELPKEMKQARWVSQENQKIIGEANRKAAELIRESEKRAEELLKSSNEECRKRLDKEQIVQQAKARAEEILNDCRMESEQLLNDARQKSTEMLRSAESQANEMVRKARTESEFTRSGADDYALKILTSLEAEFTRMLSGVQKSKRAMEDQSAQQASRKNAVGLSASVHKIQDKYEKFKTAELPETSRSVSQIQGNQQPSSSSSQTSSQTSSHTPDSDDSPVQEDPSPPATLKIQDLPEVPPQKSMLASLAEKLPLPSDKARMGMQVKQGIMGKPGLSRKL